ncbi:Group 3 truncated hemoglobin ctb [Pigmentiphaga humi]|uniref:Group 3 truncated hemoglobin ctb n=1 Tax=Pigmentiphaga humi TaxID=2478468 RepID=A0A3P4B033_9BURK|nr:group III truncated hemoglobin [Pigmentiphaga humi]VCU69659.1 Group 3 truncated hemoglobin ctb [Pigmentiphaga humi]
MQASDLCTEDEVARLVSAFYAKVRRDERLGPIFNSHIDDWDAHLAKLTDFWSSMLRGTRRYAGTPMSVHVALPELKETLFARWLELFDQTLAEQPNARMAERARTFSRRIAQSLWMGYQMHRDPDRLARELPCA